jgi:hypothetical protein
MRPWIAVTVICTIFATGTATAAGKLTPEEIQATFFTGAEFTAATPSGVKFKMTFTADGKALRVPAAGSGAKGEGVWKLDGKGYCTTWNGSRPNCFTVVSSDRNKWSIMSGPAVIATWTK